MMKMAHSEHGGHCCSHQQAVVSVSQTLQEMDFERGLWSAALDGEVNRIRSLLSDGHDVNALDSSGYAALHYAARNGHLECCRILVQDGRGDVNITTRSGRATPLQRAAYCGHQEVAKFLISKGAQSNAIDADGQTALHKAAQNNHTGIVKLLLKTDKELSSIVDNRGRQAKDFVKNNEDLYDILS